jgi:hypothetical protein
MPQWWWGLDSCGVGQLLSALQCRHLHPGFRRDRRNPAAVDLGDHRPILVIHHACHPDGILAGAQGDSRVNILGPPDRSEIGPHDLARPLVPVFVRGSVEDAGATGCSSHPKIP